jgi:hypothetical protein
VIDGVRTGVRMLMRMAQTGERDGRGGDRRSNRHADGLVNPDFARSGLHRIPGAALLGATVLFGWAVGGTTGMVATCPRAAGARWGLRLAMNQNIPSIGDIRWLGAQTVMLVCKTCPHQQVANIDALPDDVPLTLVASKFVCPRCHQNSAHVCPNWNVAPSQQLVEPSQQQSAEAQQSAEPSQQSPEPQQSAEPSQQSAEAQQSVEPSQQSAEPQQSVEPSQQSAEPQQSVEPSQQSAEPIQQSTDSSGQVLEWPPGEQIESRDLSNRRWSAPTWRQKLATRGPAVLAIAAKRMAGRSQTSETIKNNPNKQAT